MTFFKTDNFIFDVENHDVQINGKKIKIVGTFEDPFFCAKDLAEALGYKNVKVTLYSQLDQEYKITLKQLEGAFGSYRGTVGVYQLFYWPFPSNIDYHSGKAVYLTEQGVYELF